MPGRYRAVALQGIAQFVQQGSTKAQRSCVEEISCNVQTAATRQRRLSEAASLARLSEVASLYIPLTPPPSIPGVRCVT